MKHCVALCEEEAMALL